MKNKGSDLEQIGEMLRSDPAFKSVAEKCLNAAFGGKKKMEPLTIGAPTHCVVLDINGDIAFSISIGGEFGFKDYASANTFCQQHIMDCASSGVPMASKWKVRPAFVSI